MCTDLRKFIDGPSSYLTLPEELKSAIEAITYIAEALQAEKDYEAVSLPEWESLTFPLFPYIPWFTLHFFLSLNVSSLSSIHPRTEA